MKSLLLTEYKHLEVADLPVPEIGADEVLVRVKACGICGSDVHGYDGSTGRRIPPLVMGHEAAGVVARVGDAVAGLREGDRVTFDSTVYCGRCFFCRRGQVNLCDRSRVLGVSCGDYRRHGAFAEYVAVPERIVYPLPDTLSFEQAAMIEAVSVAVHAVGLLPIALNDTAVVVGSGMIGLLAIQALKQAGSGLVIAVDIDCGRLARAREAGADIQLEPRACSVAEEVAKLTCGRGADVAVEAVGATEPIKTALACLRKGGALALVGNVSPSVELPLQTIVTRQLRLLGSCASSGEYPACIEMLARGAIRVGRLISATAPLKQGSEWFARLYDREPNLMKVILNP